MAVKIPESAILGDCLFKCGSITEGERELLICGKEYARTDRVNKADMKKFSSAPTEGRTMEF